MKKIFSWKLINILRVLNFVGLYQEKFDAITGEAGEIAKLEAAKNEIQAGEDVQETPTTGITEEAKVLKKNMADTIIIYAKKGLPLARNAGKTELVKILTHGASYIYSASITTALSRARLMRKTLTDYHDIFTNIKPADVADMDAAIA
ncbi:MAG: hypothetical protein WCJ74_03070, partial [bacterium]